MIIYLEFILYKFDYKLIKLNLCIFFINLIKFIIYLMINESELNLFENFHEEEEEQKKTSLEKASENKLGKKRNRETSNNDVTDKTADNNEQTNQDKLIQENENSEVSDNEITIKVNKKDYSIEEKLRRILDGDSNNNAEGDEFKVTSYNFNGMIHDIITPKNYDKECNE
jgi:hypothetical protein